MRRLIPWLSIVALAVFGCGEGSQNMGALKENLLEGNEGEWNGHQTDQGYRLRNTTSAGSVKYLYIEPHRQDRGSTFSVAVQLDSWDSDAAAGLLYGLDRRAGIYYAFLIRRQGVVLLRRGPNGFETRFESTPEGWLGTDEHRLEIRERGQEAEFRVDGRTISSLGNDEIGQGAVGIVAVGRGDFFFREFESPPPINAEEAVSSFPIDSRRQSSIDN